MNYLQFERSPKAIKELDGLRGIAILLVLFRHAVHPFQEPHPTRWNMFGWDLFIPMHNGWMGVDLFFVLSGFLVTFLLIRRSRDTNNKYPVRDYLFKRVLRIVPAYYCVLFIVVAGLIPGYEIPAASGTLKTQILIHLLFLQDYFPGQIVVVFWSLGVEEKFYLLIPMVIQSPPPRNFGTTGFIVAL